jgi:hypothetical protein
MWSPVQATSAHPNLNKGSPVARCKHAMCVTLDGHIYLYGGRSANLPLKDLWRFDAGLNQWEEVKCRGQHPPNLQEHTMIAWNVSHDKLKPELHLFFFSQSNHNKYDLFISSHFFHQCFILCLSSEQVIRIRRRNRILIEWRNAIMDIRFG